MVFGKNIYVDGENVTGKVIDSIAEGNLGSIVKNIKDFGWDADFIKALGMMPCPYHRYYYQTAEMLEDELKEFSKGETRAEVVKRLEDDLFELYKDENLDVKPPQLEKEEELITQMQHVDLYTQSTMMKEIYSQLTLEIMEQLKV